jgi:hypothetical protein
MDPKAITRKLACKPCLGRLVALLLLALAAAGLAACDETDPAGTDFTTSSEGAQVGAAASVADGDGSAAVAASDATALGTIALPINQSIATSGVAFGITQTGTGPTGIFKINNTTNLKDAVLGQTNGGGAAVHGIATGIHSIAGKFENSNSGSPEPVVSARGKHIGLAGLFAIDNFDSKAPALVAQTVGPGPAFIASAMGKGAGGTFSSSGKETLLATNAGSGTAIHAVNSDLGNAAAFENAKSTNGLPVLAVTNKGAGFAGVFLATTATGRGILIQTQGGAGLQVVNGSKNAVVHTPAGAKALYTEESTEVWFTDYGFGRLANGRARVLLDPSFAQTINPDEPYHVFVQPYGGAELSVADRTPLGFTVALKEGDPNAEFSYRIVAKRLGFESKRLEAAPWADRLPTRD